MTEGYWCSRRLFKALTSVLGMIRMSDLLLKPTRQQVGHIVMGLQSTRLSSMAIGLAPLPGLLLGLLGHWTTVYGRYEPSP